MNYDLNRIKYVIMNIMLKHKAVDHMHSMSRMYLLTSVRKTWMHARNARIVRP